tara:strand:+ start:194 stop:562 length:369 start_codon:yes stop_codon:yes gene_type:complete
MKTLTRTKNFEVNQICEMHWGYNTSRYDFFIVTRISKSSVWFKQIDAIRIDDSWGRQWGFQKFNSTPNYKVVDGKNVPIITGAEFRKKIYTSEFDGRQYAFEKYQGIIQPWDGKVKANDHMD